MQHRELLPSDVRCVYLSGSLVRGWGNPQSDLDVYVVSDSPWSGDSAAVVPLRGLSGSIPVNAFYVDGCRWDVEHWQVVQIDALLAEVSWDRYDSGELSHLGLSRHEIDVLERLAYAQPLLQPDWLASRQEALKQSALRTALVAERLNLTDLFIEDAVGQLRAGDEECAVLSARLAFEHVVDALLASRGEFGHSSKWRPRRFRAVQQDLLSFEDYWRLETMASYDHRRPASWVEETVETCRRIAQQVVS
ncbi:nucleotidyltransferase domain-containing protein [Catellatospora tritici]|uniref:nucleotidyltransferase domain-containing protein n=1 Tax=Catellatospora tritici TaxID=2851566 RepID=UPI001C2CCA71|nr:hypothetical protein [Catellatospora tritici]